MIDYGKYWIRCPELVARIFENEELDFEGTHSTRTGEIKEFPKKAAWKDWKFEIKSNTWLQISGSLHKYWNGTNEADFHYYDLYRAMSSLCSFLQVTPFDLTVHNLEMGVNVQPVLDASEIMREIICFKNRMSIKPIDDTKGHFMEFKTGEYYFKIYDKGKQAREVWRKESGNILRVEIKAINSGFLYFADIRTMGDLLSISTLEKLGIKLTGFFAQVVFDDRTVDIDKISVPDQKVYQVLANPKVWEENRRQKSTTIRARERRFREIVEKYGGNRHSSTITDLVQQKWLQLLGCTCEQLKEIEGYLDMCK